LQGENDLWLSMSNENKENGQVLITYELVQLLLADN
jgi:hypothetical protein